MVNYNGHQNNLNTVHGANTKIQFDVEIDNKDNDYEDELVEMTFAEEDNINITAFRDMLNTEANFGRIGGDPTNANPAELFTLTQILDYFNDKGNLKGDYTADPYDAGVARNNSYRQSTNILFGTKSNENTFDVIQEWFDKFDNWMIKGDYYRYINYLECYMEMLRDMKARRTYNGWINVVPK